MALRKSSRRKKNKSFGITLIILVFLVLNNEFGILDKFNTYVKVDKEVSQVDGELNVHFIDVGQGDATLISYQGFDVLIDTGDSFAENDLLSYLDRLNIEDIDIFIGTHPHSDHIGNVKAVYD